MTDGEPQKKRHHHTPVTYLRGFTDSEEKVFAWRKDEPSKTLHTAPEEIGFEKYYYSQPLPDGGRDNNTLEDLFNTFERPWAPLIERLEARTNTEADFLPLIEFVMLQRIRGPATRDAVELKLGHLVETEARLLDERGLLPPKPEGFEDILDHMEIAVDPHMSIHAMKDLANGFARVVDACKFQVLHNRTAIDFITSDNPVAVFDPSVAENQMQPYQLSGNLRSIELLFPLSARLMLRGIAGLRLAPESHTQR